MSWGESYWITRNIVKSIQRGSTTSATTVTINAVNMEKAFVLSVSKGSAGTVAATGDITGTLSGTFFNGSQTSAASAPKYGTTTRTMSGTRTISGGTTDLTTKQYSAQLTSSTALKTDGACEWQVIEFY